MPQHFLSRAVNSGHTILQNKSFASLEQGRKNLRRKCSQLSLLFFYEVIVWIPIGTEGILSHLVCCLCIFSVECFHLQSRIYISVAFIGPQRNWKSWWLTVVLFVGAFKLACFALGEPWWKSLFVPIFRCTTTTPLHCTRSLPLPFPFTLRLSSWLGQTWNIQGTWGPQLTLFLLMGFSAREVGGIGSGWGEG